MAAKSESVGSYATRRCSRDSEQSQKNSTLCKAAALGCCADVACGSGRHGTVARADLLATRSIRPKVPADPSAKRPRAGGGVAACARASVGTALATTVHRRGVAAAQSAATAGTDAATATTTDSAAS